MTDYIIASFYRFQPLENIPDLRARLLKTMNDRAIKGTLILAEEGINGSFAGTRESMDGFYKDLRVCVGCPDLSFRETSDHEIPFNKAKVKCRKEIVTMGIDEMNPADLSGEYLDPQQWHELIQDPEVVVIDTRNIYEYHLGTFKGAINPQTENFRDFPEYVEHQLMEKKDKKIAMFCTGGIRCEKSTAYLKKLGFEQVYHLKGGILNYLEQQPKKRSLWEGSCFVFDDRVAIDHDLKRVLPQLPQKEDLISVKS